MKRFLIVRLGSLGDLVHAVPAVTELRAAHPDAQIDWLVERPHAALLERVPAISNVIVLKGRSVRGWLATRAELRAKQYDVAVDLQGLVKSAALARLSGAKRVVGFDTKSLREPAARVFYTEQIPVDDARHVIEKNRALVHRVICDLRSGEPTESLDPWTLGPLDRREPWTLDPCRTLDRESCRRLSRQSPHRKAVRSVRRDLEIDRVALYRRDLESAAGDAVRNVFDRDRCRQACEITNPGCGRLHRATCSRKRRSFS